MRALLWHDLVLAARVAVLMPEAARHAALVRWLDRAHAADKYRKATGRAHRRWGDGTLAAARRPGPLRGAHGGVAGAGLLACNPLWNGRTACTTLGTLQETAHDHRPPTPHCNL
ncbi:MAG: hypothetical protein H3C51_03785 [Rubellimicrobium sp.]|nr:hypothetical protein [Rubellimicrobium sp.]